MRAAPRLFGLLAILLASACSSGGGPAVADDDGALRSASLSGWGTAFGAVPEPSSLYVSSPDHDAGGPREVIWILPEEYFQDWQLSEFDDPPPTDRACASPRCTVDWLEAGTEVVEIRWAVSDHRPEPVVQVSIEDDAELTVEVKLGPRRQLGEDQDSVEHLGIGIAVLVLAEPVGDGQLLELTLSA